VISPSAACSGNDCRTVPGAGAPGVTGPVPVFSGSTGAMSAATQPEYLSLLLELPFNKIFMPWPGGAGEGREQGRGLAPLWHGRLGQDAVLSVGPSVPVQGGGGVTASSTAMWE